MAKTKTVKALLIDPFKQAIVDVLVPMDFSERWRQLLDCEHIEHVRCEFAGRGLHAAWIDEEGYLRQPAVYPLFRLLGANGGEPMAGYALITGAQGPEISEPRLTGSELGGLVSFEVWGQRLKSEDFIDQLLKLYLPWP